MYATNDSNVVVVATPFTRGLYVVLSLVVRSAAGPLSTNSPESHPWATLKLPISEVRAHYNVTPTTHTRAIDKSLETTVRSKPSSVQTHLLFSSGKFSSFEKRGFDNPNTFTEMPVMFTDNAYQKPRSAPMAALFVTTLLPYNDNNVINNHHKTQIGAPAWEVLNNELQHMPHTRTVGG